MMCCVIGCDSMYRSYGIVTFHKFPKEGIYKMKTENGLIDRREVWQRNLKIYSISTSTRVCSLHFQPGDYIHGYRNGRLTQLRGTAVPTQNLPTTSYPSTPIDLFGERFTRVLDVKQNNSIKQKVVEQTYLASEIHCKVEKQTKSTPDVIKQVIMKQENILDPLDCGNHSELEYTSEQMILTQDEINSQLIPTKHEIIEDIDMFKVENTNILYPLNHNAVKDTAQSTQDEMNSHNSSMKKQNVVKQEIIEDIDMFEIIEDMNSVCNEVDETNIDPLEGLYENNCKLEDTGQQINSLQDEMNVLNAENQFVESNSSTLTASLVEDNELPVTESEFIQGMEFVHNKFGKTSKNSLDGLYENHCNSEDIGQINSIQAQMNVSNTTINQLDCTFDESNSSTLTASSVEDNELMVEVNYIPTKQETVEDTDMVQVAGTNKLHQLNHNAAKQTKSIQDEINFQNYSVKKTISTKQKIIEDINMIQVEDTNILHPLVHCTVGDLAQQMKSTLINLLSYTNKNSYQIRQKEIEDPLDSTNNTKTIYTAEQIKSIRDEINQPSSTNSDHLANPNDLDLNKSNQELLQLKLMIAQAEAEIDFIEPQKVLTDTDKIFIEHAYCIKSQKVELNYISCNTCCGSFDSYKRLNEHNRKWTCTKCNTSFQASCEYIEHKHVCYRCDECNQHFSRLLDYKSHTQLKGFCSDCHVLCNNLCLLRKHKLDNHAQVQKCIYCFSIYDKKEENYHSAGCITCENCCKTFPSQCLLMIHLNYCLPCKHCNFIIKHAQYKHTHIRVRTEHKTHNCCNQSFVTLCKLNQHMNQPDCKRRELLDKVQYTCTICMKLFKTVLKLKSHSWEHVGNQCDICKKRFYSLNLLNNHIKDSSCSTNNGKCKCLICGARFTSTDDLQKHIIVHSDENPFICDLCGKSFESEKALNCHKKDHMNTKQIFKCNVCKNQFSTAKSFEYHVCSKTSTFNNCSNKYEMSFTNSSKLVLDNEISAKKKFKCGVCMKMFSRKSSLVSHMRFHTEKPYSCKICQARFKFRFDCTRHSEIH